MCIRSCRVKEGHGGDVRYGEIAVMSSFNLPAMRDRNSDTELSSASLRNWNVGTLECWNIGFWEIGILVYWKNSY